MVWKSQSTHKLQLLRMCKKSQPLTISPKFGRWTRWWQQVLDRK